MNLTKIKHKLRGFWKSRTAYAGALLGLLVGVQPQLMDWMRYKLEPADYALAGVAITGAVWLLRWITDKPLDEK